MEKEIRLDEVTVFGGKLRFLIPHDWEELETDHDNVYLYSHPQTDSGWFRVSLNTSTVVEGTPAEKLKRIFEKRENVCRDDQTGNLPHSYERDSEEDGVKIHLYYWIVANVVEPNLVREAVSRTPCCTSVSTTRIRWELWNCLGNLSAKPISILRFTRKPVKCRPKFSSPGTSEASKTQSGLTRS